MIFLTCEILHLTTLPSKVTMENWKYRDIRQRQMEGGINDIFQEEVEVKALMGQSQ